MSKTWNITKLINLAIKYLAKRQVILPRLSVELILASILKCNRIDLYLYSKHKLTLNQLTLFFKLILRRRQHEPLAYILGQRNFWNLSLIITPNVFIPRPETEHLIEESLKLLQGNNSPHILDLCTGAGTIGLTLAKERIDANIIASDISPTALTVANLNSKQLNLSERIHFLQGNLWSSLTKTTYFNLITVNPPYISNNEWKRLMREVKNYEPKNALMSGPTGLEIISKIILEAPAYLYSLGWLLIELGVGQAINAIKLAQNNHYYDNIYTVRDLAGIERVLVCRKIN